MDEPNVPPAPPPPGAHASGIRFFIPGDVFASLCVTAYHISDELLVLTRLVCGPAPDAESVEQALRKTWARCDGLQKILRIICEEGEVPTHGRA